MKLLLDENVSPRIAVWLRDEGHDVYHVRERGRSGAPDHLVWRRAIDEGRVLVTIDARDFVKLAARERIHGGLITFPSGSTPEGQLAQIRRAIARLESEGEINRWIAVGEGGEIVSRELPSLR